MPHDQCPRRSKALAEALRNTDAPIKVAEIFDFNRVRTYPAGSFNLDLIHIFGDGWDQHFARDLRRRSQSACRSQRLPDANEPAAERRL
jgi:hypothetical protein